MKWVILLLPFLIGCHTHEHDDVHSRITELAIAVSDTIKKDKTAIWDAMAETRTDADDSVAIWMLECRLVEAEMSLNYLRKEEIADLLERIKVLERITGGRRHVLKKELIELEDK